MSVGETTNMQEHPERKTLVWNVKIPHVKLKMPRAGRVCCKCFGEFMEDEFCSNRGRNCTSCRDVDRTKKDQARYEKNRETLRAQNNAYYAQNKDAIRVQRKEYRTANRDKVLADLKESRDRNPDGKIAVALRRRVRYFLGEGKNAPEYLGCTKHNLRAWFEYNFVAELKETGLDMTWENYGSVWEIDHVIPCSAFDMNDQTQVHRCFHWTNLAPISSARNKSKNRFINQNDVKRQYRRLMCFEAHLNTIAADTIIDQTLPGDE